MILSRLLIPSSCSSGIWSNACLLAMMVPMTYPLLPVTRTKYLGRTRLGVPSCLSNTVRASSQSRRNKVSVSVSVSRFRIFSQKFCMSVLSGSRHGHMVTVNLFGWIKLTYWGRPRLHLVQVDVCLSVTVSPEDSHMPPCSCVVDHVCILIRLSMCVCLYHAHDIFIHPAKEPPHDPDSAANEELLTLTTKPITIFYNSYVWMYLCM